MFFNLAVALSYFRAYFFRFLGTWSLDRIEADVEFIVESKLMVSPFTIATQFLPYFRTSLFESRAYWLMIFSNSATFKS